MLSDRAIRNIAKASNVRISKDALKEMKFVLEEDKRDDVKRRFFEPL